MDKFRGWKSSIAWSWITLAVPHALTTTALVAMVLSTLPTVPTAGHRLFGGTIVFAGILIAGEFIYRLSNAIGRYAYLVSAEGLIDLASALALPAGWLLAPAPRDALLFATVWALRYIRGSTGLVLFLRIMRRARAALLSIASLFLVVFLGTATLAYVFEREIQPDSFGSIPRVMWWAIVTLTTTGYGDVIPATFWGRLLGGWIMVGGIVMFALQAGIIATAFAEELQRRHFLRAWDLVSSVSFFQDLGAAAIADIVGLVKTREVTKGTEVVRAGEPGDTMYFVVTGEATVQLAEPVKLGPGGFFGEMSLLFGTPRSATVTATQQSVLLMLDIADFRQLAGRRPDLVTVIEAEGKRRRAMNAAAQTG